MPHISLQVLGSSAFHGHPRVFDLVPQPLDAVELGAVISYVYEPGSYVPLARLDAQGQATEQGGLGTTDDATAPAAKTIATSAGYTSAGGLKHHQLQQPEANDAEAQYWEALNAQPSAKQRTGTEAKLCDVYYFHTDQVGMPQELTNAQGQLVWQASYKTWGSTFSEEWEVKSLTGQQVHSLDQGDIPKAEEEKQQNLRFQGQYLDRETGLHYNTFRYYDADVGRFICPDPIGLGGGINLGTYSSNPLSWIDPWGLSCSFDSKANRWRNNETGRFTRRPTDPSELVQNGRANYGDVKNWADQGNILNTWNPNLQKFPSGGFKYQDGTYSAHGHGTNPSAVQQFPGSNAASGPTVSIKGPNGNFRTDGSWGAFGSDPNGAHIPLGGSPF